LISANFFSAYGWTFILAPWERLRLLGEVDGDVVEVEDDDRLGAGTAVPDGEHVAVGRKHQAGHRAVRLGVVRGGKAAQHGGRVVDPALDPRGS
jgi:hypothetical protein